MKKIIIKSFFIYLILFLTFVSCNSDEQNISNWRYTVENKKFCVIYKDNVIKSLTIQDTSSLAILHNVNTELVVFDTTFFLIDYNLDTFFFNNWRLKQDNRSYSITFLEGNILFHRGYQFYVSDYNLNLKYDYITYLKSLSRDTFFVYAPDDIEINYELLNNDSKLVVKYGLYSVYYGGIVHTLLDTLQLD